MSVICFYVVTAILYLVFVLQALVHDIYSELVEDACLGLCFEVHRAVKQGYFFLDETDQESMKEFGWYHDIQIVPVNMSLVCLLTIYLLYIYIYIYICWVFFFITPPEIVDQPGVDIFGQVYNQWKNKECECPNCKRLIAASRFAPHLEKCLGMGRNSSRIANRRSVSKGHSGVLCSSKIGVNIRSHCLIVFVVFVF